MPTNHALLAPSASKRWMTCAPSALAESKYPEEGSVFALEGTYAHSVAETCLRICLAHEWKIVPDKIEFTALLTDEELEGLHDILKDAERDGFNGQEIFDTVYDDYVSIVFGRYLEAKAKDPEAVLLIEAELDLKAYIPEGFGSSDAVIIYDNNLEVVDLKYGRGVKVEANHNTQMMCYALGALMGPAEMYNIDFVSMVIIQPRLKHVSTATMLYGELVYWGQNELRPAAQKAMKGEGNYIPGDHCKFCKCAPTCTALWMQTQIVTGMANMPASLSDEQLSVALANVDTIKGWISKLEEFAIDKMSKGGSIPGWKIVEGRSVSKITNVEACKAALFAAGFQRQDVMKPEELKGISELKTLLRSAGYKELVAPYVSKPQGKPTLAPADDPRPVFNNPNNDFSNL